MQIRTPKLRHLLAIQLLVGTLMAGAGAYFGNARLGASIAFGAGLMLVNVFLLGWSSNRLIAKKSIASTTGIIVIKYAVLLGSIGYVWRMDWFHTLGVGIGIASLVVSALVMAVQLKLMEEKTRS